MPTLSELQRVASAGPHPLLLAAGAVVVQGLVGEEQGRVKVDLAGALADSLPKLTPLLFVRQRALRTCRRRPRSPSWPFLPSITAHIRRSLARVTRCKLCRMSQATGLRPSDLTT